MRALFAITLIALSALFFASCKKDDISKSEYPLLYHKINKEETGSLRVFTTGGEIKIKSIIDRFTISDTLYLSTVFTSDLFDNPYYLDSVKMTDQENGEIFNRYSYTYEKFDINTKGRNISFTGKDTTTGANYGEVFTRDIKYKMSLYKPFVFNEYLISSTTGYYLFGYDTKNQFHFTKSGDELKAPFIIYTTHNPNVSSANYIQNKLDPDFFKWIHLGDTIVTKEYYIVYGR